MLLFTFLNVYIFERSDYFVVYGLSRSKFVSGCVALDRKNEGQSRLQTLSCW